MSGCCGCLSRHKASEPAPTLSDKRRALHYVLKIGNRQEAITFFKTVLGMKILRHDEFSEPCLLSPSHHHGCGPCKWSRTMVGYGPEDSQFVLELIYNYGIRSYTTKCELLSIEIMMDNIRPVMAAGGIMSEVIRDGIKGLMACCVEYEGYVFKCFEDEGEDRIGRVVLSSHDVSKAEHFWMDCLGMSKINESLMFASRQCKIQFKKMPQIPEKEFVIGRIGFSAPKEELKGIQEKVNNAAAHHGLVGKPGGVVKTPLTSLKMGNGVELDVLIIKDADDHEILFFGDEAYRLYSQQDPNADKILQEAMEWEQEHPTQSKVGVGDAMATRFSHA